MRKTENSKFAQLMTLGGEAVEHLHYAKTRSARNTWDEFKALVPGTTLTQEEGDRLWHCVYLPLLDGWASLCSPNDGLSVIRAFPRASALTRWEEYARRAQRIGHDCETRLLGSPVYPETWPLHLRWHESEHDPHKGFYPAWIVDYRDALSLIHFGERRTGRLVLFERLHVGELAGPPLHGVCRARLDTDGRIAELTTVPQQEMPRLLLRAYAAHRCRGDRGPRTSLVDALSGALDHLWSHYLN